MLILLRLKPFSFFPFSLFRQDVLINHLIPHTLPYPNLPILFLQTDTFLSQVVIFALHNRQYAQYYTPAPAAGPFSAPGAFGDLANNHQFDSFNYRSHRQDYGSTTEQEPIGARE